MRQKGHHNYTDVTDCDTTTQNGQPSENNMQVGSHGDFCFKKGLLSVSPNVLINSKKKMNGRTGRNYFFIERDPVSKLHEKILISPNFTYGISLHNGTFSSKKSVPQ